MSDPRIRRARPDDVPALVGLVHELADYEREPESCHLTEEQLHTALFGEAPSVFCHAAEIDGEVVGLALWFRNFSTWEGVHGVYLEDLYVRPAQRGSGLGKALLATLARECVEHGYGRLEWVVLDWNAPSIAFYESLGARPLSEWTTYRLTGDALRELGG
ncbi:GNAT family N-acetyltransferase [Nocardioides panacisoli]|uniref:GNAT family N-acetyltransferase n=1 Tax=Nocardioides panacisoli TaxID=627624 RepID=UPI001C634D05|nr:GNAT family N-acetyltransferase [Nocardioides panacisoli]QYJ03300.1 GNAT family N-acetyltransferase [Nocardioides panacisoli]